MADHHLIQTERVLNDYKNSCERMSMCHERSSRRFRKVDSLLSIPMKICSLTASSLLAPSVMSTGSSNADQTNDKGYMSTSAMVLTSIAGILAMMQGYFNPMRRSEQHKAAFLTFGELEREIKHYFIKDTVDRPVPMSEFADIVEHKITLIQQTAPEVPLGILDHVTQNLQDETKHAEMRAAAVLKRRYALSKHPKRDARAARSLSTWPITDLRSVIRDSSSHNEESGSPHSIIRELADHDEHDERKSARHSRSVSTSHTAITQARIDHAQTTLMTASKQELLETILLDCGISADDLIKRHRRGPSNFELPV